MRKVIIGAGPAGLYTAIKLRKEGIKDVVIYDPRAGNYTRPGHLNRNVFSRAQEGLGLNFWPGNKVGHIKDLEKELYKEAQKLGIKIENKLFLKLHQDEKHPGVIVADEVGNEEFIEADYVFDCTGTRRAVVAAVNKVASESPLQLTKIADLPVRNHFLAYVKISKKDWARFEAESELVNRFPETVDSLSFAQLIIKLRALGWQEFKFPRCYGMEFGKDKVCLYLHAPDGLAKENYDSWVQTVLGCYADSISYKHLPSSTKPRFLSFPSSAQALKEVSYKGNNLPTVIALGDAQIDFDYYLAHGIRDGMERINALFEHAEIFDNEIYYFDSAEYMQTINTLLKDHKEAVTNEAERVKQSFVDALETAQLKFRHALMLSKDTGEQGVIIEILKEIEARQSYIKARKVFAECHNSSQQVVLTSTTIDSVIAKLNNIQTDLLKGHSNLPLSFTKEHEEVKNLLLHLATSWKEVGNALFKSKKIPQAIECYKKALEIYNLACFSGKHVLKELPLYSNLAITYLQNKLYSEAITAAHTALLIFDNCRSEELPTSLQEKIVFNLIKALCVQAQELLASCKTKDAEVLHLRAKALMSQHQSKLTSKTLLSVKEIIDELQLRLPSRSEAIDDSKASEYSVMPQDVQETPKKSKGITDSLDNLGIFGHQQARQDFLSNADPNSSILDSTSRIGNFTRNDS